MRIMPNPYGSPRPEVTLANSVMFVAMGLSLIVFRLNQSVGVLVTAVGFIGGIFAWVDVKRSRRAAARKGQ